MSAIEVFHNNVVREKEKLFLHSPNITKDEAEKMNFDYVDDLQQFVESRKNMGKTIGRLRASTFVVPYLK